MRDELLHFASLIELELDFAEEDVEFANREELLLLVLKIQEVLKRLIDSFAVGNVIKNGIPVAIVGEPNVGKSTLLNALLNEDRAIVSEIAGTTRDTIEDEIAIGGIGFRFIDTAGIRETVDVIERMGIKKTFEKMGQAQLILYLSPLTPKDGDITQETIRQLKVDIERIRNKFPLKSLIIIGNKKDLLSENAIVNLGSEIPDILLISAKNKEGIPELKDKLISFVNTGILRNNETIVSNTRHYNSLLKALEEIHKVKDGLATGISGDLLAIDIREALNYFGEITGQITSDDLLGNIFANFCIGK